MITVQTDMLFGFLALQTRIGVDAHFYAVSF